MRHEPRPAIVQRSKRCQGHLRQVIEMLENGRTSVDIAQQLHAVARAVTAAKSALFHDHVERCPANAREMPKEPDARLAEFRAMTRCH